MVAVVDGDANHKDNDVDVVVDVVDVVDDDDDHKCDYVDDDIQTLAARSLLVRCFSSFDGNSAC